MHREVRITSILEKLEKIKEAIILGRVYYVSIIHIKHQEFDNLSFKKSMIYASI